MLLDKYYHTLGTVPKSNKNITESDKIDIRNTQIYDRSLSWLGTGTSIKSGHFYTGIFYVTNHLFPLR
jgi:hypothetical protein